MATQRTPPAVTVTRASLTLAATFGLARVFAGPAWVVPVGFAACAPAAILALAARRRWHPLATTGVVALVGVWLALLVDDPATTIAGIPTRTTFASFFHDLGRSPHELRSAVVPVAVGGAALLLAVVAAFGCATLTELLALRFDGSFGAIGPSVGLFVVTMALGSGRWAPATACYALAALAYLLALQHEEVAARRAWFHAKAPRPSRVVAGGIGAAVVVVLVAVTLGPAVPGARGGALLDYRSLGAGSQGSVLSAAPPILSLRDKLTEPDSEEVFTVKTDDGRGYYWRVIALDHLSGDTWTVPPTDSESASKLPGPSTATNTRTSHQHFDLERLDAYWLPAAYRPTHITLKQAQLVPSSDTLYLPNGGLTDVAYDVDSSIPQPTHSQLLAVTRADLRDQSALTELPSDFPQSVRDLAQRVTAGAKTPFAAAAAIEAFFSPANGFTYTLDTNLHSSASALEEFLFHTRAGFCEQYASAFAAMARAVGLPTRVAVGYQSGAQSADGVFHVTNHDAHAWPEVWLGDKVGWYPFEPTPGRTNPATGRAGSTITQETPTSSGTTTPPTTAAAGVTPPSFKQAPGEVQIQPGAKHTSHHTPAFRVFLGFAIAAGVALLAALAWLLVMTLRRWRRSYRRRHHPDPRWRVLGAWAEALEHMESSGIDPKPSATPVEFALRHAPAHGAGEAGPSLMQLARLQTVAMFSPEPPSEEQAVDAWTQVAVIDRSLRHAVPRFERWRHSLRH